MQLIDATLRPLIEASIRDAWNPANIHPDTPRGEQNRGKLPRARVNLLPGQSQSTGGGAASRDCLIPHTYEITGTWSYPTADGEATVNREAILRANELLAKLTEEYPRYGGWRYSEEIGWDWEDNKDERTYDVTITFTILVIGSVRG